MTAFSPSNSDAKGGLKDSRGYGGRGRLTGFRGLWADQRNVLMLFTLSLLYLIYSITRPPNVQKLSKWPLAPAHLHVLIPASSQDVNLCKVMLSAAILGYPSPVIVNWNKTFDDKDLVAGGSHLAKISGIHDYVASLGEGHDEDLVLMVDGYDIWFQLRPQILIDRYYDINRRADARIRAELGPAAEQRKIRQEIVFGCQKRCWPWALDDPPCYAVPQSSLAHDIYGPQTDTDIGNVQNPFLKYRQRFLNSGVGIGTVRAMRKLFGQALAQAQNEQNFGSDQYIFSHIFGDQEVWREIVKRDSLSTAHSRGLKLEMKAFPESHLTEVRKKASIRYDKNFEFGIGVDYGSEIGLNTVFAEDDTEWISFNNEDSLRKAQETCGIEQHSRRLTGLAVDIANSLPPFWTFSNQKELPRWTSWSDASLFTDVWTGITPAIIHHNAHRDGMKSLREAWWPKIWFQKHARILFDAHIYAPVIPIAVSGYDNMTTREWWPYEIWKGGARNGPAKAGSLQESDWIRFDTVCRPYHEELFRDGKGSWELPWNH